VRYFSILCTDFSPPSCLIGLGINILGVVENMSGISLPLSQVANPTSGMRLTNARGEDMTDSLLLRIQEHCPELLELNLTTTFFTTSDTTGGSNNPVEMAKKFNIPYLGKIPMDGNLIKSCEDGFSFLQTFPSSVASEPFRAIVMKIIEITDRLATQVSG
jgi:hypothetical protein